MKQLTIIVPVDKFNDEISPLFEKACKSVPETIKLMVVGPKEVLEAVKALDYAKAYTFVECEDVNPPTMINTGVNACKTDYFSVLEYDDVFTPHWFENLEKWYNATPDLFAYMPINEAFQFGKDNLVAGYINEPVWASSFSEQLGYFDTDSLMNYMNANCTGTAFKKDEFLEIGGLKESIKLTYWYELLLRADYKAKKIYVIPKVGYKHCIDRPGSLLESYRKTMTPAEADWWVNTAREEHFFKNDRKKQYQLK